MSAITYLSNSTTAAASTTATSASTASTNSLNNDKEAFLKILLTQLENQNPLEPVDTTEFTSQLTAYSQLEQLITMNEKLDTLTSSLGGASSLSAFSYIGTEVDISTNASVLQDGEVEWAYTIESDAEDVTLQVSDANGTVIASYDVGESDAGTYGFTATSEDLGSSVSEGAPLYLSVVAKDSSGANINTATKATVTISGVETSDGNITLNAGSLSFSADNVTAMRSAA